MGGKKKREVSSNSKKGCTPAQIEKEGREGEKRMGIVIVVRRSVKKLRREDMTGLFLASCKQLFIC